MTKVLHVNDIDLQGRRFNGYDLLADLAPRDVHCTQAVLTKLSRNPQVIQLMRGYGDYTLQHALLRIERDLCMDNLLYPWGRRLTQTQEFSATDVIHCHLIHNRVVSLFDLPMLCRRKPLVWTLHDPWALTGHCVYPLGCEKWVEGCEGCPRLKAQFPMERDCADRMWRVKQRVYTQLDADIVVASPFMYDMVKRSPLTSHFDRVHLIPFGIDPAAYLDDGEQRSSRKKLGIPESDFVILCRATNSEFKGLDSILESLMLRPPVRPTTVVTVDKRRLMRPIARDYNVVDLGWVDSEDKLKRILCACDLFLMPSTAEAFGLMALEAMAAGRPVISFEGTSVPSVTHAPECGIAVPMGDARALRDAIDMLAENPGEAQRRGDLGRVLASRHYARDDYLDALTSLYEEASHRRSL